MTGQTVAREFQRICVYCGSSNGVAERYFDTARTVGADLAGRGIGIVFGGGSVGLMGAVADAALAAGGEVIGIIPKKLQQLELGHAGVTRLEVVDSMHQRKLRMAELSDGFIALPGGWGTLEEIFEVTTWTQLEYHVKPVGFLNAHGYYDKLLAFIEHAADEGFIRPSHRHLIQADDSIDGLLGKLAGVELPSLRSWIAAGET